MSDSAPRRRPRIAVVGSINIDLVVRVPHFARPGETVLGETFEEVPGGKGANQAVAAARLGAEVMMIGRVGDDAFGRQLTTALRSVGVDVSHVLSTPRVPTGVAIVAVEASGENSIMVVPGANGQLTPEDVEQATSVIANADLLLVQLEVPIPTVLAAIDVARAHETRVILDPAPAPETYPDELLEVDLVCPNESELATLLGVSRVSEQDLRESAAKLQQRGPQHVIVTRGEKGAWTLMPNGTELLTDAVAVDAKDSTAAGDAFAAGLAVGLAEDQSLDAALRLACATGALAASRPGAQPAMPTRMEVESRLSSTR